MASARALRSHPTLELDARLMVVDGRPALNIHRRGEPDRGRTR